MPSILVTMNKKKIVYTYSNEKDSDRARNGIPSSVEGAKNEQSGSPCNQEESKKKFSGKASIYLHV
jgi:hypothetical protein